MKKIEQSTFANCRSLESITIPQTVTIIRYCTFFYCRSLREVGLHDGIQKIGPGVFDATSLERFVFPNLSTRLANIIRASQREVEDKVDEICGPIERRGSELFIPNSIPLFGMIRYGGDWKIVKEVLGRIDRLLTYYELKEATTLLELAMWKCKVDQAEVNPIERDEHRIDIPGPVRDTILQYLDFR